MGYPQMSRLLVLHLHSPNYAKQGQNTYDHMRVLFPQRGVAHKGEAHHLNVMLANWVHGGAPSNSTKIYQDP